MKKSLIFRQSKTKKEKIFFFRPAKILLICVCLFACALFTISAEASAPDSTKELLGNSPQVNVYAGGRRIFEGQTPLIESVTYVSLRAFSDEMGADSVSWNAKTKTATVTAGKVTIKVTDGTKFIDASERILYCPTGIRNINDRLYVPIRAISTALSLDVEWDGATRSALLSESLTPFVGGKSFYNSDDFYWLSRIINAEAGGEPFMGKIAVGNVVLNRVRSSAYPNTIYKVIFDRKHGTQFSPVSFGTIYNTPNAESVLAAKICLEGYSLSNQILFFVNPKYATSNWIERNRPYAFTIGGHNFYN